MRDLIVTLIVFGSLPLILKKPFYGVLVWTWLGLMNAHRLCWGFAREMPFAYLTALGILGGLLLSREAKRIPGTAVVVLLAVWWAWTLATSLAALGNPWSGFEKISKILLMIFVAIALLNSRERIQALVWVCVVSLGLYGVKGGIFTVLTGGNYLVWGPAGTFIGGNNEIGLALIMTVPLMRYLQLSSASKAIKNAMLFAMVTTFFAIVGTHSRGAFLGVIAMAVYLTLKSRNKLVLVPIVALALPAAMLFMPEDWAARMGTIENFEEDRSAMGRINAWWAAFYLALDRPIVGGGFNAFTPSIFVQYAPDPTIFHDAHSIYFEVLGEHGFVGLGIYLSLGLAAFATLGRVGRYAKRHAELTWMRDLASMVSVSLLGYAVSGAFLGLAYFDFYYTLIAIAVGLTVVMERYRRDGIPAAPAPMAEPARRDWRRVSAGRPAAARVPSLLDRVRDWYNRL